MGPKIGLTSYKDTVVFILQLSLRIQIQGRYKIQITNRFSSSQ